MSRLISIAAGLAAVTAMALPAFAQSQADIASRLNEEGKEQMYGNNYSQASVKFREAVARVPEPKYFFNLCTSLFQEGKFGEALTACNAVEKNNPSADLQAKATKLVGKIKAEATTQGIKVEPEGGGGLPDCATNPNAAGCAPLPDTCATNPSAPECQPAVGAPQPPPAVGRPPSGTGVFAATTPDNKYIWTLGADVFGGGGAIGQKDAYGTTAGGFRIKGDFLFNAAQRIGGQGYVQYAHFSAGEMDLPGAPTLDVIDTGVAVYKHLCPQGTQRLCLTPLVGAHLALMSPQGDVDEFDGSQVFNYAALGGRAEIGLQYAFGSRYEHVLSITAGANLYTAVFAGPSQDNPDGFFTAEEVGLDKGGAYGYFGVGYTHRFSTPLGSSPFITLE